MSWIWNTIRSGYNLLFTRPAREKQDMKREFENEILGTCQNDEHPPDVQNLKILALHGLRVRVPKPRRPKAKNKRLAKSKVEVKSTTPKKQSMSGPTRSARKNINTEATGPQPVRRSARLAAKANGGKEKEPLANKDTAQEVPAEQVTVRHLKPQTVKTRKGISRTLVNSPARNICRARGRRPEVAEDNGSRHNEYAGDRETNTDENATLRTLTVRSQYMTRKRKREIENDCGVASKKRKAESAT